MRTFSTPASAKVMKTRSSHCTATNQTQSGTETDVLRAANDTP